MKMQSARWTLGRAMACRSMLLASLALVGCGAPAPPPAEPAAEPTEARDYEDVLAYYEAGAGKLYLAHENAEEVAKIVAATPVDETHWRIRVPEALLGPAGGGAGARDGEGAEVVVEIEWGDEAVQLWNERTGKRWKPGDPDPPWEDLVRIWRASYCATVWDGGTEDCRGPVTFEEMDPPQRWIKTTFPDNIGQCQDGGTSICWEKWHHVSDSQLCTDSQCASCDSQVYPQRSWMCLEL